MEIQMEDEIWFGMKDAQNSGPKKMKIVGDVTQEANKFKPEEQSYVLHLEGDDTIQYKARLNKGSTYNLIKAWGKDTAKWTGKMVRLEAGKIGAKDALLIIPVQ